MKWALCYVNSKEIIYLQFKFYLSSAGFQNRLQQKFCPQDFVASYQLERVSLRQDPELQIVIMNVNEHEVRIYRIENASNNIIFYST